MSDMLFRPDTSRPLVDAPAQALLDIIRKQNMLPTPATAFVEKTPQGADQTRKELLPTPASSFVAPLPQGADETRKELLPTPASAFVSEPTVQMQTPAAPPAETQPVIVKSPTTKVIEAPVAEPVATPAIMKEAVSEPAPAEAGAAVAEAEKAGAVPKELSFAEKLWKIAPKLAQGVAEALNAYYAGLSRTGMTPQYQIRQQQEFEAGQSEKQFAQQKALSEIEAKYAAGLAKIKQDYDANMQQAQNRFTETENMKQRTADEAAAKKLAEAQADRLETTISGDIEAAKAGRTFALKTAGIALGDQPGKFLAGE